MFWVALLFGNILAVCGLKLGFVRTKFPQKLGQKGIQNWFPFENMTAKVEYKLLFSSFVS